VCTFARAGTKTKTSSVFARKNVTHGAMARQLQMAWNAQVFKLDFNSELKADK
jgi:hypothetical protein